MTPDQRTIEAGRRPLGSLATKEVGGAEKNRRKASEKDLHLAGDSVHSHRAKHVSDGSGLGDQLIALDR